MAPSRLGPKRIDSASHRQTLTLPPIKSQRTVRNTNGAFYFYETSTRLGQTLNKICILINPVCRHEDGRTNVKILWPHFLRHKLKTSSCPIHVFRFVPEPHGSDQFPVLNMWQFSWPNWTCGGEKHTEKSFWWIQNEGRRQKGKDESGIPGLFRRKATLWVCLREWHQLDRRVIEEFASKQSFILGCSPRRKRDPCFQIERVFFSPFWSVAKCFWQTKALPRAAQKCNKSKSFSGEKQSKLFSWLCVKPPAKQSATRNLNFVVFSRTETDFIAVLGVVIWTTTGAGINFGAFAQFRLWRQISRATIACNCKGPPALQTQSVELEVTSFRLAQVHIFAVCMTTLTADPHASGSTPELFCH